MRLAYARNLLTQEQSDRLHPLLNELSPKLNFYSHFKSFVNFLLPPLTKGRVGVG
ncbi:hypothetical protein [Microcoleus sp. Pol11C2]|uniref:hypothetical protein n=1 Tax=Microcoleus sp. Pol11C2 TaxID=3055389 RepID=UPI004040AE6E